ncbi:F0F1 ATP synthase subunit B [Campylobacter fetus]|uniref:ATP synthase subunit b n=1 Tax=Campylobacter fetus subsp. testudinum TaxID=1507806 RepID=A0AAX0HCG5_CAMFE|nr:F0F1 ATP synthase subunit B [Campylobacter fetus]ALV65501.1 ATP synthase, F0 complex, b subunit [Campylobacter fetus subsp. testudinum Sp3]AVK81745.1 F0F1 ATP synthase subunit B [Campylobacter fetus subsp. testudinum]MPB72672.1 F0F1 ATP synthase subunit B [Campylobacter fetus]MPB77982.1 F0F1 ATP synthase subunit B [Campylobacter fetus]OCR86337.1 ATP synthase F0F1 subunit B [Campylobacter fetus subsp. testudinum]
MNIKFLLLLLTPVFVFGADANSVERDYDIFARTINFAIFAGILYYLIAEPVKKAYKGRINSIAARLDAIQDKLRASKAQKDDALKKVEDAKNRASGLLESTDKEIEILISKIEKDTQNELLLLQKSYEEQKDFEERKIIRSVVGEILDEVFAGDTLKIDQSEFVNLVLKKVS